MGEGRCTIAKCSACGSIPMHGLHRVGERRRMGGYGLTRDDDGCEKMGM